MTRLIKFWLVLSFAVPVDYGWAQLYFDDPHQVLLESVENELFAAFASINRSETIGNKLRLLVSLKQIEDQTIEEGGFRLKMGDSISIEARDRAGLLYGVLHLAEKIRMEKTIWTIQSNAHNPSQSVRAIKYNLPWSAYRESQSMDYHHSTCRDLTYWESFLDMMLFNRFNTLLLYNKHPFPFMVKLDNYPEACTFSEDEMKEWQKFWNGLFSLAARRSIDVFIVNWNIVVSPSFAQYHGIPEYNDTSALTRQYTRTSVTQLINTYPDLAGIGVTLADWMNGMTPSEKEDWINQTFISGIKDADREVRFLHRAVLSGSSDEMRRVLDQANFSTPALVEVKFNWSHGHSTPKLLITHASEEGEVNTGFWDPSPTNYHIQWMIRNEDFFILRWGDPDFVREHLGQNMEPYMNGYHIGSEGYIPALDYFTKDHDRKTWRYAFQRQWLFYAVWGRLLYDETTPDEVFEQMFNRRYKSSIGEAMLNAYKLASKMPLRLASFFKSTWDYTLYSEGFMSAMLQTQYGFNDGVSPFISISELMDHQVLDTSFVGIKEYANRLANNQSLPPNKVSPLQLSQEL
ncbi:MAG: hypothetical protein OEM26_05590, partial [Saprospiraceae bacterium]|nr:hypothetical protein [Saprospiraceae bacterium]